MSYERFPDSTVEVLILTNHPAIAELPAVQGLQHDVLARLIRTGYNPDRVLQLSGNVEDLAPEAFRLAELGEAA